jgi:MoaA/NifB/PqqE/SkfB family radical SAM enzyme
MTLLERLNDEYSAVVCQDIGDFFAMSWGDFYSTLQALKHDEYQDRERLIFYLRDRVGEDLLSRFFRDFFQQLAVLDIPSFFVILVLPSEREAAIASRVHESTGTDDLPTLVIDSESDGDHLQPTEITTSRAAFGMPATACPLPWNSLDISPVGGFAPCCFYQEEVTDEQGRPYDPKTHSLGEVYNSKYMQKLRQLFRDGVRLQACSRCWKEEESGTLSKRQLYAMRWGHDSRAINWEEDDERNLKMLSVSFGNTCNLKCRICSDKSSSKIAGEMLSNMPEHEKKTSRAWQSLERGKWISESTHFWDDPTLDQIKYFDFAGGEPLLDKNHLIALKRFVDQGTAKDITIHYNTNGTIINDGLLETWSHFKKIDLAVSVDDIGQRFNYQRHGGSQFGWDLVSKNIDYIKHNKTSNIVLNIHCAVSILNVFYLPDLCDWIETVGFEDLHFSVLYNPLHLSLLSMPMAAAQEGVERLSAHRFSDRVQPFIDTVIGILSSRKKKENPEFVEHMIRLDSIRKENISTAQPELAKHFGFK